QSLPLILDLIKEYGTLSYYSLNASKTQALGVRLSQQTLTALKKDHNFEWRTDTIKYLGLTFTKNPTETFPANYVRVWGDCRQLMKKWSTLFLTWTERVATVKMFILPRLQYLFRNLPIQVPMSYLRDTQKDVNRFVWGGQKARVQRILLQTPVRQGGLALPDIKTYYQAALLATTLPHFTNTALPQWVLMEKQAIKPFDVPTIMWLPKKFRPDTPQMPTQLKIAVRAWDKLRHKLVTPTPLSPATPLNTITYCIPTFNAKPWIAKGVTYLHQILAHNKLKTFPTLQKEFHIPEASQFSYIQLSSFIRKHAGQSSAPDDNPL
ncbi:Hypothetical predicted protein, partial [Pelobates cultripes]